LEARRPFRNFTYPLTKLEGRARHVRISGRSVFDSQGEFRGYQGTGSDLTDVIQASSQAAHAEATLMDDIESIDAGLALLDTDDRLVLCNSRFQEHSSGGKEIGDSRGLVRRYRAGRHGGWFVRCVHARVRGEDAPLTYVFEGIRKDGTRLWLENRGRGGDLDGADVCPAHRRRCHRTL